MAIVKVRAKDGFAHGRLYMEVGQTASINHHDAQDLEKAGLVEIISEVNDPDATDDLVGGKMEPVTSNKMDGGNKNKNRDR